MDAKRKELLSQYKEREIIGGVYLVRNTRSGKSLLETTTDMRASRNRFDFSQKTGSCADSRLQEDWKKWGAGAFVFETLDEITKSEAQSIKEFETDLASLKGLWLERLSPGGNYA